MKNFPSSLIRQKNTKNGLGTSLKETLKNTAGQILTNMFGSANSSATLSDIESNFYRGYVKGDIESKINDLNIISNTNIVQVINESNRISTSLYPNIKNNGQASKHIEYQDPFVISEAMFSALNNYMYLFSNTVPYVFERGGKYKGKTKKDKDNKDVQDDQIYTSIIENFVVPSLFSPYAGISVSGINENISLVNGELTADSKNKKVGIGNTFDDNALAANDLNNDKNDGGIPEGATQPNSDGSVPYSPDVELQGTVMAKRKRKSSGNSQSTQKKPEPINIEEDYQKNHGNGNLLPADGKTRKDVIDQLNKETTNALEMQTTVLQSSYESTDCSIQTLVALSSIGDRTTDKEIKTKGREDLGLATYRYADFMFCKDLGKISNNHLITLRKFPGPIGDNIFHTAHPRHRNKHPLDSSAPDIGRLVTWFGNEDNKLEDICKYNYKATWKKFTSEIDQQQSKQSDQGFVNQLANFLSPSNNMLVASGFSGNCNLIHRAASFLHIPLISGSRANQAYHDSILMSNYDKHRIYEPPNRIWDTHKYEGKLEFNQDITITFRYVMRSYLNINPKAAFLDLIGNIQTVTYRRGSFWGGQNKVYGPQGNSSVYNKANAFIDNAFEKLGGIWDMLANGGLSVQGITDFLGNIWNMAKNGIQSALEAAETVLQETVDSQGKNIVEGTDRLLDKARKGMTVVKDLNNKYHWTDAMKGMIKNQLGRPAIYAFNSLLTGEPVGPWHLTIGNPRNPIMAMGNLILESSEVTHLGPLGLDDFPTEIKVTVTLKHAMSRDSVGIQKMYTKGNKAIHLPFNYVNAKNYWVNTTAFPDVQGMTDGVLKQILGAI